MRVCFVAILVALANSWAWADLSTVTYVTHDGGGDGRVEGDMTGVGPVQAGTHPV